jgi:ubiquinone/menaquinone biosynthesis C-methylase UbiE
MNAGSIVERPDASGEGQSALREHLHGMWSAVAAGWGLHADFVETRGVEVTQVLLDRMHPQPGERVLELACGAGGVGIAAARRVAPGGEVVLSDFVPEMTAIAAGRAAEAGLANVTTRVLDLEQIEEPDGSYDVVVCREGLMFATDPAAAAGEIRRVLRPGGRVALAVWGPRARNPWLGLVFDAVSEQTGSPVPPPGVPEPFSLGDVELLGALLRDAGLREVRVTELPTPLRARSFDEWWSRTSALAGPLAKVLAALPEGALQALRTRLQEAVAPYETPAGIEIPGVALIASARR